MGQVFLAHMPGENTQKSVKAELQRLRLHDSLVPLRTLKDVHSLAKKVRANGLARVEGALIPELGAIAAPIFGSDGKIVAAIGVIGPGISTKDKHTIVAEQNLLSVTSRVSDELGYIP